MNCHEIAKKITEDFDKKLTGDRKTFRETANRASELGHECLRYLVYLRTNWQDKSPPELALLKIFRQGRYIERETIQDLAEIGFEWAQSQRPFYDEEHQISGHIDGGVVTSTGDFIPGEIKSMQGSHFDRIRQGADGLSDMLRHSASWVRKYPYQIATYLYLTNEPEGIIILRDKWYGRMNVVPVPLEAVSDLVREVLAKAKRVNEYVASSSLPSRIEYSDDTCGRCPFGHVCLPSRVGAGAALIEDRELIDKLHERANLDQFVKRHKQLDDEVKDALKVRLAGLNVGEALVGNGFVVSISKGTRRRLVQSDEEYEVTTVRIKELDAPIVPLRDGK